MPEMPALERPSGNYTWHRTAEIDPTAVVGDGTIIWGGALIMAGTRLGAQCSVGRLTEIGRDCRIGDGTRISRGVFIPNRAVIGRYVFIGPHAVMTDDRRPSVIKGFYQPAPPVIEDHVSIGAGAVLLPGVRIGEGAMVGAGAVVTKDVPPWTTVVGCPARRLAAPRRLGAAP